MKLEIDGEVVSEEVTAAQIEKLDLKQSFNISEGESTFLQWWIDEEDGSIEIYHRAGEDDIPKARVVPAEFDQAAVIRNFTDFLAGKNDWVDEHEWEAVPGPGDPGVIVEDWALYPRRLEDDSIGMIFYNHGVIDAIDDFGEQLVKFTVQLKSNVEDGSPTDEEEEVCSSLEEAIEVFVDEHEGIYVGRLTENQNRHFFTYADLSKEQVEPFLEELRSESTYEISASISIDPENAAYWNDLFPTEQEYQLIADSRIVGGLEETDEQLMTPRPIQHLAMFASEEQAAQFEKWALEEGFVIEHKFDPDEESDEYGIQFARTDIPELFSIHQVTLIIRAACSEFEGIYEGWQCAVAEESD